MLPDFRPSRLDTPRLQSHKSFEGPSAYSHLNRREKQREHRSLSLVEISELPYRRQDSISQSSSRVSRSSAGSSNELSRPEDCIEYSEQRGDYNYVVMQNIRNGTEPTHDDHE